MNTDRIEVIRWSNEQPPNEALLRSILADEDLHPYMWSNGPGDVYGAHSHSYHKVIYVVRGSITFGLPESGDEVTLNEGDRLELAAGVTHKALVGHQGFSKARTYKRATRPIFCNRQTLIDTSWHLGMKDVLCL